MAKHVFSPDDIARGLAHQAIKRDLARRVGRMEERAFEKGYDPLFHGAHPKGYAHYFASVAYIMGDGTIHRQSISGYYSDPSHVKAALLAASDVNLPRARNRRGKTSLRPTGQKAQPDDLAYAIYVIDQK